MKSKPDRYGIKIWANCENPSGYVWNSQVYTGQISSAPEKKQGQRVVLDLVKDLGQGYGVTCDNFFTSLELAKELAKQDKTLLGTIKQIRKEVPRTMLPSKSREVNSSLFLSSRDATMVSYVPRKNKSVILLSSQHSDHAVSTAEHAKPDIILDYNKSKGAVGSADKMLKEFFRHRISKRWPFVLLTHVINVCALNAYLLYKKKYPNTSLTRLNFLKELGSELVKSAIKTRANPPRTGIPTSVQAAMGTVIGLLPQQVQTPGAANSRTGKRNRCAFCPRSKDAKYSAKCSLCSAYICHEHTESNVTTCVNCNV